MQIPTELTDLWPTVGTWNPPPVASARTHLIEDMDDVAPVEEPDRPRRPPVIATVRAMLEASQVPLSLRQMVAAHPYASRSTVASSLSKLGRQGVVVNLGRDKGWILASRAADASPLCLTNRARVIAVLSSTPMTRKEILAAVPGQRVESLTTMLYRLRDEGIAAHPRRDKWIRAQP